MMNTCQKEIINPPYFMGVDIRPAITTNQSYQVSGCNGFNFINRGNTSLTINNDLTLDPGQSWAISGQWYDIIEQTFDIRFGTVNLIDAGAVLTRMEVILIKKGDPVTLNTSC